MSRKAPYKGDNTEHWILVDAHDTAVHTVYVRLVHVRPRKKMSDTRTRKNGE